MTQSIEPGLYEVVVGPRFLSFVTELREIHPAKDRILEFHQGQLVYIFQGSEAELKEHHFLNKDWVARGLFENGQIGWFHFNDGWLRKIG